MIGKGLRRFFSHSGRLRNVRQGIDEGVHRTTAGIADPTKSTRGGVAPIVIPIVQSVDQRPHRTHIVKPLKSQCSLPQLDFSLLRKKLLQKTFCDRSIL